MESPVPLSPLETLSEARPVRRRPSPAVEEVPGLSPARIATAVTVSGALLAAALVALLVLY